MKEKILSWIGVTSETDEVEQQCIKHASAALMIEIMAADKNWDDSEQEKILELLCSDFELSISEASEIISVVSEEQKSRHDLFQFTQVVNEKYSQSEKFELLKNLWKVASSDGEVDAHEEHLIRRVADLIHLPHRLFIQAKIAVREECASRQ